MDIDAGCWRIPEELERRVLARDAAWRADYAAWRDVAVWRGTRIWLAIERHAADDGADVVAVACRLARECADATELRVVARHNPAESRFAVRDMLFRSVAGWTVMWPGDGITYWTGYYIESGCGRVAWEYASGLSFGGREVVNPEALAGTRYAHSGWSPDEAICLVDWLHLWEEDHGVELLARAGLQELITPLGVARLRGNRAFYAFVRQHADEIVRGRYTVREIVLAQSRGIRLEDARTHYQVLRRWTYRGVRIPERVRHRAIEIDRWISARKIEDVEYGRYIHHALGAGWDIADEHVLFPPRFRERLELAEREAERIRRRRQARRDRVTDAKLRGIAERYDCSRLRLPGGLAAVVAASRKVLREEGERMRNCIGHMGYDERMVSGESLIVFLRRGDEPVADVEIALRGARCTVRQCYARGNRPPSADAVAAAERVRAMCQRIRRKSERAQRQGVAVCGS